MKRIKEKELRELIKAHIKEELNRPFVYDKWLHLEKYPLTEGLTMTYSVNKVIGMLERKYELKKNNIKVSWVDSNTKSKDIFSSFRKNDKTTQESENWYWFSLYFGNGVQDESDYVNDIIHTCNACGWYLSDCTYYQRDGVSQNILVKNNKTIDFNDEKMKGVPLKLSFRAKFNVEYKSKSVPPFLYHVCPLRVVPKILKQGLTPRNNGRIASHPERVYLFIEYNNGWKNDVATNFKESGKEEPYAYLKIDMRNINPQIKFYYDSNVMTNNPAIYTLEPIPPSAIELIDKEDK